MDAVEMKGRNWILQIFQDEKILFHSINCNEKHRERKRIIIGVLINDFQFVPTYLMEH